VRREVLFTDVAEIMLWDSRGSPVRSFMPPGATVSPVPVRSFRLAPDVRHALFADSARTAALVPVEALFEVGGDYGRLTCEAGGLLDARFSPLGDRILTIGSDHTARVFAADREDWAVLPGSAREGSWPRTTFSPAGRFVVGPFDGASIGRSDRTAIWDTRGNLVRVFDGNDAVVAPDDSLILTFGEGGGRLSTASGAPVAELPGATSGVFSAKGDRLATGGALGVRVCDRAGKELATLSDGDHEPLGFSPDGALLLVLGHRDRAVRVWNPEDRSIVTMGTKCAATFSADGARICLSTSGGVSVLDRRGNPISRFDVPAAALDGSPLRRGAEGRTWIQEGAEWTRVYDEAGRELCQLEGSAATTTPDGELVLTGTPRDVWRVFRLDGRQLPLGGTAEGFRAACFSPKGDRIATVSADGVLRIFGREGSLELLVTGAARVDTLCFSPDGKLLLTTGDRCRLWSLDARDLLRLADERAGRELSPEERRRYADLLGTG
jgi:WD40 repeat protein